MSFLSKGLSQEDLNIERSPYTGSLGLHVVGGKECFYLSDDVRLKRTQELTGLSFDEIIAIVGKFKIDHMRAKMPKGKCVIMADGSVVLQHHYNSKILWGGEQV